MQQTLRVIFDGEVFRPEEPVDLEPNAHYEITVIAVYSDEASEGDERPLRRYAALAQDLGIEDLAAQHDHYLYGTPKR
ncbi:MAG: antitoxin family protein [Dehalococcoidia bacterium]